jgi:carbamate kinase
MWSFQNMPFNGTLRHGIMLMPPGGLKRSAGEQNGMKIVIALGGNAILQRGEAGTAEEQFAHVESAVARLADLVSGGEKIIITHGNGPQVGDILLKNECAAETLPRMPLDVCGAESQGMIGYMIQQCMENALRARGIERPVLSIVTQTLVDPHDPAFAHPSKPIGPHFTEAEADAHTREHGWCMREAGSGVARFRRVVPSPEPLDIIEQSSIGALYHEGFIVIAAGGGGIPVYRAGDGKLRGIEAVVDKDLAAEKLATGTGARVLLILTDVPGVYLRFGTPEQELLGTVTAGEARRWLAEGRFAEGSMAPKVRACVRFVEAGGEAAIITSLDQADRALGGTAGTRIVR